MSEVIKLEELKVIKKWIETNTPKVSPIIIFTAEKIKTSEHKKTTNTGGTYFAVEHTLYTEKGWPLVTLSRIFRAKDAENALSQYIFGPSRHTSGKGEEFVDVTFRDNFTRVEQEIQVFKIKEGTKTLL